MRIILLTSRKHVASCISVGAFLKNTLLKKHGIEVVGIVASDIFPSSKGHISKFRQMIRRTGFRFTLKYILTGFVQLLFLRFAKWFMAEKNRPYFELGELAEKQNIPILKVSNINSSEVLDFCQKKSPDYVVSSGLLQIVKKPLLDIPQYGSLNFHPSLVQEHRGTFSSFWALFRKKPTSGATVHYMTEKIDDGKVILQRRFFVKKSDSIYRIDEKSARLGGNMLVKALVKIKKKKEKAILIRNLANILSAPDRKQVQKMNKEKKLFRFRDIFIPFWIEKK